MLIIFILIDIEKKLWPKFFDCLLHSSQKYFFFLTLKTKKCEGKKRYSDHHPTFFFSFAKNTMFPQSFLILSDLIPVSSIYSLFPLFFYRSSDRVLPISHDEPQTRWPGPTIRNINELVSSRILPIGGGPPPPTGSILQPTGPKLPPTGSTLPPMIVPCRWCQTINPGDCRDGFCASMWNKENLMRPIHI